MLPVILGPTGSGKTEIASLVAQELEAEVVVADSRQVYRGLPIGSNLPTAEQRARCPFHLIDFVEPSHRYSAFEYQSAAAGTIAGIQARGKLALLEGATMLYVRALTEGFSLGQSPPDPKLRAELEAQSSAALVTRLRELDPSAVVDTRNPRRLVRAVEILETTGRPLAAVRTRRRPPWVVLKLGVEIPLAELDARLAERTRAQLAAGLVAETRAALEAGVPADAPALTGTGAADATAFLRGEFPETELYERVLRSNRRLARRQRRWLRSDPEVSWFDVDADPVGRIVQSIRGAIS